MSILIYIYIFILFIIIFTFNKSIEFYDQPLREFKNLTSLKQANIDELEQVGVFRHRSKAFMKKILAELASRIPPNSVNPGERCTATKHIQCKGDSVCYSRGKGLNPVCTAGVDGVLQVGVLDTPNAYGSHDNGSIHHFPRNTVGCHHSGVKCPPRFKCHPRYDACIEYEIIKPTIKIPKVESSRIAFQPPLPLEPQFECPDKYEYFEKKQASYCKHKKSRNICALEAHKRDGHPFCSTAPCPAFYYQLTPGICENEDNKTCSLEANPSHPLCGGRNDFLKIKNMNIEGNNLEFYSNYNEKECASKCLQKSKCHGFVYRDDNTCFLKKNIGENSKNIEERDDHTLFLKTPINYSFQDKTIIKSESIDEIPNKSYIECAEECDKNDKCMAFVVNNDKDFSTCELKRSVQDTTFNETTHAFKKKDYSESMCPNMKTDKIQTKIETHLSEIEKDFELKLNNSLKQLTKESIDKIKNKEQIVQKNFLNKMIQNDNIIIIDNINIKSNKIVFEKLDKLYLHMSILQIWGKLNNKTTDFIQDKNTSIKMSSIFRNHNESFCRDSKINTFMSTTYDNTTHQYIEINLPDEIMLHKIIIFNKIGKNKDKLVPFKINLYKNDVLQQFYIKKSFDSKIILSKIPKIDNIEVKDFGDLTKYTTVANIEGLGDTNYCRFINIKNKNKFACTGSKGDQQHIFDIETPYDETYFKYQNKINNTDDLCRCTGVPEKSDITCTNTLDNKDYVLANMPNCDTLTGSQLKTMLTTNKNLCTDSTTSKINCGFYWEKTYSYFLFKNTIINNKKVVLFTRMDSDSLKIQLGYPKIVNKKTWNNLSFQKQIDSVFMIDKNTLILTYNDVYVKFDLVKFKQLPNYPKKIKDHFRELPNLFSKQLTSGSYISQKEILLCNNKNFIKYNSSLIEFDNNKKIDQINTIEFKLSKLYPGITFNEWNTIIFNYDLDILLIFSDDKIYVYDTIENVIKSTIVIKKNLPSIWKIQVNNL